MQTKAQSIISVFKNAAAFSKWRNETRVCAVRGLAARVGRPDSRSSRPTETGHGRVARCVCDGAAWPVGRDIPIAPQGNARAEWTRARAVRGLAARALGGASRETRQPIIAPYRNGTRACAQWICAWPPGLPAPWRLATLCTKQITRAGLLSGVDRRHYGGIRKKSLLFFASGENLFSLVFSSEIENLG